MKKSLLLLGIPVVALSVCLILTNRGLTNLEIEIQKNRSVIMELTDAIVDKTGTIEQEMINNPLTEEEKETVTGFASELGNMVANYQNIYQGITSTDNPDEFKANVENLSACFTEDSQSARVPWYYGEIPGTWTFINDGKFKGADNKVIWVCRDVNDGSLLAYAVGFYDKETEKFKSITHKFTMYGAGSVPSDEGELTTEIDIDKVNAIVSDIENVEEPETEKGWSAGDMNDVRGGQEALREYYKNGGGSSDE